MQKHSPETRAWLLPNPGGA